MSRKTVDVSKVIDWANKQKLFGLLTNSDKAIYFFDDAGHELMRPFDPAHEQVWRLVFEFIRERSSLASR